MFINQRCISLTELIMKINEHYSAIHDLLWAAASFMGRQHHLQAPSSSQQQECGFSREEFHTKWDLSGMCVASLMHISNNTFL